MSLDDGFNNDFNMRRFRRQSQAHTSSNIKYSNKSYKYVKWPAHGLCLLSIVCFVLYTLGHQALVASSLRTYRSNYNNKNYRTSRSNLYRRQVIVPAMRMATVSPNFRVKIVRGSAASGNLNSRSTPSVISRNTVLYGPHVCGQRCCRGWKRDRTSFCITLPQPRCCSASVVQGTNKPLPAVCIPSCKNNGYCVEPNKCRCRTGYSGNFCSRKNSYRTTSVRTTQSTSNRGTRQTVMLKRPTHHHGTRVSQSSRTNTACGRLSCFNGGRCKYGTCDCPTGYTGRRCEKVIITAPRSQNAVPKTSSGERMRKSRISLKLCQSLCKYGTCTTSNGPMCKCYVGYRGPTCNTPVLMQAQMDNTLVKKQYTSAAYQEAIKGVINKQHVMPVLRSRGYKTNTVVNVPRSISYLPIVKQEDPKFQVCYKRYGTQRCELAFQGKMTYEACCDSGMGDGWGKDCTACNTISTNVALSVSNGLLPPATNLQSPKTCRPGYERNDGICEDLDECQESGDRCLNGECVNSPGSYWCSCNEGYHLHDSKTLCLPNHDGVSGMELGEDWDRCYTSLTAEGLCEFSIFASKGSKATCCCSVGLAWGHYCEKCPKIGTPEREELCPFGNGYRRMTDKGHGSINQFDTHSVPIISDYVNEIMSILARPTAQNNLDVTTIKPPTKTPHQSKVASPVSIKTHPTTSTIFSSSVYPTSNPIKSTSLRTASKIPVISEMSTQETEVITRKETIASTTVPKLTAKSTTLTSTTPFKIELDILTRNEPTTEVITETSTTKQPVSVKPTETTTKEYTQEIKTTTQNDQYHATEKQTIKSLSGDTEKAITVRNVIEPDLEDVEKVEDANEDFDNDLNLIDTEPPLDLNEESLDTDKKLTDNVDSDEDLVIDNLYTPNEASPTADYDRKIQITSDSKLLPSYRPEPTEKYFEPELENVADIKTEIPARDKQTETSQLAGTSASEAEKVSATSKVDLSSLPKVETTKATEIIIPETTKPHKTTRVQIIESDTTKVIPSTTNGVNTTPKTKPPLPTKAYLETRIGITTQAILPIVKTSMMTKQVTEMDKSTEKSSIDVDVIKTTAKTEVVSTKAAKTKTTKLSSPTTASDEALLDVTTQKREIALNAFSTTTTEESNESTVKIQPTSDTSTLFETSTVYIETTPTADIQIIPLDVLYPDPEKIAENKKFGDFENDYANIPPSEIKDFKEIKVPEQILPIDNEEMPSKETEASKKTEPTDISNGNELEYIYEEEIPSPDPELLDVALDTFLQSLGRPILSIDDADVNGDLYYDIEDYEDGTDISYPDLNKLNEQRDLDSKPKRAEDPTDRVLPLHIYENVEPKNLTGDIMRTENPTEPSSKREKPNNVEEKTSSFVALDLCSSNPCKNGARCSNEDGFYYCQCSAGFAGDNCEIDFNECISSPCLNGKCQDKINGFLCECEVGYTGNLCENDVNECEIEEACGTKAICFNTPGSYQCVMPSTCSSGYKMAEDGRTCLDVNECINSTLCSGGRCVNEEGSYHCECKMGYVSKQEGKACEDLNECETVECAHPAVCENLLGTYRCKCPNPVEYYDFSAQICKVNRALLLQQRYRNRLPMTRKACYSNPLSCESMIAPNITKSECCCTLGHSWGDCGSRTACPRMGTVSYKALCPHGRGIMPDLLNYRMQDIDECQLFGSKAICRNGNCQNSFAGYKCVCHRGYYYNHRRQACDDINECLMTHNCLGGTCRNLIGRYECICPEGFTLQTSAYASRCTATNNPVPHTTKLSPIVTTPMIFKDFCYANLVNRYKCGTKLPQKESYKSCCCGKGVAWGPSCSKCPDVNSNDYMFLCPTRKLRMREPFRRIPNNNPVPDSTLGAFHEQECGVKNGCNNGICVRTTEGDTCECNNGYQFKEGTNTCEDIDECNDLGEETNLCLNAECNNLIGSFECLCWEGYSHPMNDRTICLPDMKLIDPTTDELLQLIQN